MLRQQLCAWLGARPYAQFGVLGLLLLVILYLGHNLLTNMAQLGLTPGFEFLVHATNFEIGSSLIAYDPTNSYWRALLVGLLNTLQVAVIGCIGATLVGIPLGIARLSTNPLLRTLAQGLIGLIRNTPLLLQLFCWNALLHALPAPRQALQILPFTYLSNRGLYVPELQESGLFWLFLGAILILGTQQARCGRIRWRTLWAGLPISLLTLVAGLWLLGQAPVVAMPQLQGFNFTGGAHISPEFTALTLALIFNAAASIAEIVRAGIQSVPRGQWEAARALGLRERQIMGKVILPQALKVILPVLTSTYLSLTKNSSLAVAIGYPDIVSILNTTANITGQVLEAIVIMASIYLLLSLLTAACMNRYNHRLLAREQRA